MVPGALEKSAPQVFSATAALRCVKRDGARFTRKSLRDGRALFLRRRLLGRRGHRVGRGACGVVWREVIAHRFLRGAIGDEVAAIRAVGVVAGDLEGPARACPGARVVAARLTWRRREACGREREPEEGQERKDSERDHWLTHEKPLFMGCGWLQTTEPEAFVYRELTIHKNAPHRFPQISHISFGAVGPLWF